MTLRDRLPIGRRSALTSEYDKFAPYYAELIRITGDIERQCNLLDTLLSRLGVYRRDAILDGACGTGDALLHLVSRGYHNLEGIDGSHGMITEARSKLPRIPLHTSEWLDISRNALFHTSGYRLIYLLGISLLHSDVESMEEIMRIFHGLLISGGHLALDVRKWRRGNGGILREAYRKEGVDVGLARMIVAGRNVVVTDKCTYTANRQIVQYTISEVDQHSRPETVTVDYALCTAGEMAEKAIAVGFDTSGPFEFPGWPYYIILAQKRSSR